MADRTSNKRVAKHLWHLAACLRGSLSGRDRADVMMTVLDEKAIQEAGDLLGNAPETEAGLLERLNAEIDRLDWDSTAADAVGADECVRFDDGVIKILKRIRGDKPSECSGDPGNCPENEGHGCTCSPVKSTENLSAPSATPTEAASLKASPAEGAVSMSIAKEPQ